MLGLPVFESNYYRIEMKQIEREYDNAIKFESNYYRIEILQKKHFVEAEK